MFCGLEIRWLVKVCCADAYTFFDTRTPVDLLQIVHPDIYVKGGDYDMENLEETRVVRSWGGESVAIPFVDGFSTTALVQRIRQSSAAPLLKAAFLDRDGVINKDKGYVYRWEDFEFMPGAIEAMQKLQSAGYALVIVTNQSGLARGYAIYRQTPFGLSRREHYVEADECFRTTNYFLKLKR